MAGQGAWLAMAYLHEMQGGLFWGRRLWLALWTASLLFFGVNIFILRRLLQWVSPTAEDPVKKKTDGDAGMTPTRKSHTGGDGSVRKRIINKE